MAVMRVQLTQNYKRVIRGSKWVCIARIAGDAGKAEFGNRASCNFLRAAREPRARLGMHAVHGVKERNQNIDIKQCNHSSSRSAFTDSKVALLAPGWVGMNGRPVVSGLGVTGSNALTSFPAVLRCHCATSLTDAKKNRRPHLAFFASKHS